MKINWNLPLNPGGNEPAENEINDVQLRRMKARGITAVRVLSANDQSVCPTCRALHSQIIKIDDAINGKVAHNCTNPKGCRCYYQPYLETGRQQ